MSFIDITTGIDCTDIRSTGANTATGNSSTGVVAVEVQLKSGDTYLISIVEIDGGKQPRFIPYLDDETETSGAYSQISHLRMFQSSAQSAYTGEILDIAQLKPEASKALTDMGDVTYNEINDTANVSWTSTTNQQPNGLFDILERKSFYVFHTSTTFEMFGRFSTEAARDILKKKCHFWICPVFDDLLTIVSIGFETDNASDASQKPYVRLFGRYTTRNRENGVRSRRFGVR
tara:strand:- start:8 stop:703 length:696 start_codon:yes stop_codon:yes gene_type:complete